MIMFLYLGLFIFIINISFFFYLDSFIKILLAMEFMSVTLIFFMFFCIDFGYFILYFLIFSVCEGVLGLNILIFFFSYYGSDYFKFIDLF